MFFKRVLLTTIVASVFGLAGYSPVSAEDTDIYFTDPSASGSVIKPNMMLILDTSGSMNERNSSTATQSRIDVMKGAVKTILDDLSNVNVGLMRFSSDPGGPVMYPAADIDAEVTDAGKIQIVMQDSRDDASQNTSNTVSLTGTTLGFNSSNPYIGVRFQDVYIPRGSTITSAKVVFHAAESDSGSVTLNISADKVANATQYEVVSNNLNDTTGARPQTTAAVTWAPAAWTNNGYHETADISSVVQEVVNVAGWCYGNAMAFKFSYVSGSGERVARAYDTYHNNSHMPGSAALVITYNPPSAADNVNSCNQISTRVSLDTDDAEERANNGNMTRTGVLQLIRTSSADQVVGLRFQNVAVPQGATIMSASLQFEVDSTNSAATSLTIKAQAADNAATFVSTNFDISSRPQTTASTTWSGVPDNAVNQKLTSPDLTAVVQEVVSRAGWASGNAMALVITGSGTKNVESFDSEPGAAPLLRITYSTTAPRKKRVRDVIKELVVGMRAEGATPIVDALYEAALYYRGNAVDYGKKRGPGSDTSPSAAEIRYARWSRVSHPLSYTSGTVNRDASCTDTDLDASACFNENISGSPIYKSPISAHCQPNHIVLLTDGDATVNNSTSEIRTLTGASSCSDSGSNACGVTLVRYLQTTDQTTAHSGTQAITTHTIGYQISNTFLQNLATNGGGLYKTATDADDLVEAFDGILNEVLKSPTSFVSPSLSVNAFNKLFNRDEVYFSLFSPQLTQTWPGNIKKYVLCNDATNAACTFGEVLDADALPAINASDSKIKTTARSYWSTSDDGPTVTVGAAGSKVPAYSSRRVYTYTGTANYSATPVDLTTAAHRVETANTSLTQAMLGAADATERSNVINWMRGQDIEDEDSDGVTAENRWSFSDALHSRPLTVSYGGTAADPIIKIIVGTNDGGLRMVNATTGEEEWIVYFPEFLDEQKTLMANVNGSHLYGVDGSASVLSIDKDNDGVIEPLDGDKVYIYVGLRRGGRAIYAFDITPTATLTSSTSLTGVPPKFMWRITENSTGFGALGQTWSQPLVADIRIKCPSGDSTCDDGTSAADSKTTTVLLFAGGYDPRLDTDIENTTWAASDNMGNAIYVVDPLDGTRIWWASSSGSGADLELANMKYAIPSDLALMDSNADNAIDRIYVGDTRGQIWRLDLGDQIDPDGSNAAQRNGGSQGYVFADVGCADGTRSTNCSGTARQDRRKFFYPPDIAQVADADFSSVSKYDLITIGSGDREDPTDKFTDNQSVDEVHNRIYAFRDIDVQFGPPSTTPTAITDGDLYDATNNDLQDPTNTTAKTAIRANSGWYIDLRESSTNWIGEKVLAKATIFDGQLFVTTFVPSQDTSSSSCPTPAEGTAKLYTLNYLNATAVDSSGDRDQVLGGGIPSELVVVIREGGTTGLVGTSGGAARPTVSSELPQYKTYWRED